jgi:hypothetical protein
MTGASTTDAHGAHDPAQAVEHPAPARAQWPGARAAGGWRREASRPARRRRVPPGDRARRVRAWPPESACVRCSCTNGSARSSVTATSAGRPMDSVSPASSTAHRSTSAAPAARGPMSRQDRRRPALGRVAEGGAQHFGYASELAAWRQGPRPPRVGCGREMLRGDAELWLSAVPSGGGLGLRHRGRTGVAPTRDSRHRACAGVRRHLREEPGVAPDDGEAGHDAGAALTQHSAEPCSWDGHQPHRFPRALGWRRSGICAGEGRLAAIAARCATV